jgi:hypothetical protein
MLAWEKLTPAVDRAANVVASNFPAHHDVSDIKQEIWVWVMQNKNTVTRVLTDADTGIAALDSLLVKAGNTYLKKEDAATYGYQQEDRFFYSVELIKSILEVIFRYEDWQSFAMSQDTQPRAKSEPATSGNNLASYVDVKAAVEKLPEDYYNLIVWRYKYQYTFTMIGEQTGTTKQSVSERHERAVRAIQTLLGQQSLTELRRGFDGRTEARGNASGQARVERDYEG